MVLLIIALKHGIIYIAFAELASTIIHFFINTYYPGKIMKYGALKQIKDMLPILISGSIMTLIVFVGTYFLPNDLLKLCMAPFIAIPTYFVLIRLFKVKELQMVIEKTKGLFKR